MIIVFLPAYNEENSIQILFESLDQSLKPLGEYRIVVVDDGSSDNTPRILEEMKKKYPLDVITHERNLNLGRAMLTGLSHINEIAQDDDLIITMDADNTHSPDVIRDLINNAEKGDVGIASRYQTGGGEKGLSGFRSVMSRGAGTLLDLAFRVPNVRDYTCGFRLYHPSAIRKGFEVFRMDFISETGFTSMAEILIRLHIIGLKFYEVPLVLRYDLKGGQSKMKVLQTIMRYFKLIVKLKRVENSLQK